MFRRSRGEPPVDPELGEGELLRSRGRWRGRLRIDPFGVVPVSVPGSRSGPDPGALALAHRIPEEAERGREAIQAALAEHRLPYTDGAATGADDARVTYASVIVLDGELVIELGYQVGWDDDHTLGARLRDGRLIELNGSVVEP